MLNIDESSTNEIYNSLNELCKHFVEEYKDYYPREENKARILNTGILLDNIKEANQIDDNNNYIYSNIERYKIILKNNKIFFKEYVIEDHKKILLRKFHSFLSTKLKIHIDELMSIVPSYKKSKKKTNQ